MQGLGGSGATSLATSPSGALLESPRISLSSLHHAVVCQARSLGCLEVKLAAQTKPKGGWIYHKKTPFQICTPTISLGALPACFFSGPHTLWSVTRVTEWGGWSPTLTCLSTSGQPWNCSKAPSYLKNWDNIFQHPWFSGGQDGAVSIWEWAHATQVSTVRFFTFSYFSFGVSHPML